MREGGIGKHTRSEASSMPKPECESPSIHDGKGGVEDGKL